MNRPNCDKCSWYVSRPKNAYEVEILKNHSNILIDTRFCTLGGCDGNQFIDRDRERKESE